MDKGIRKTSGDEGLTLRSGGWVIPVLCGGERQCKE